MTVARPKAKFTYYKSATINENFERELCCDKDLEWYDDKGVINVAQKWMHWDGRNNENYTERANAEVRTLDLMRLALP